MSALWEGDDLIEEEYAEWAHLVYIPLKFQ